MYIVPAVFTLFYLHNLNILLSRLSSIVLSRTLSLEASTCTYCTSSHQKLEMLPARQVCFQCFVLVSGAPLQVLASIRYLLQVFQKPFLELIVDPTL